MYNSKNRLNNCVFYVCKVYSENCARQVLKLAFNNNTSFWTLLPHQFFLGEINILAPKQFPRLQKVSCEGDFLVLYSNVLKYLKRLFDVTPERPESAFGEIWSDTVKPVRLLWGSDEFCSVFVHIRLANQMLMLMSGRVARQGSNRMVISPAVAQQKRS